MTNAKASQGEWREYVPPCRPAPPRYPAPLFFCAARTNGDSFYEYLLKMYVLWGDLEYWDMFMQCYLNVQV